MSRAMAVSMETLKDTTNELLQRGLAPDVPSLRFSNGEWRRTSDAVPSETELTIRINGQELVTILCTPTKLTCLVIGFLYSEGIIADASEVASMRVCEDDSVAEVTLSNPEYTPPARRSLTSGCGGGVAFGTEMPRVESDLAVTPVQILALMKQLQRQAELYRLSGGVHTSALASADDILVLAEDIGRHNTLDKIQGECLLRQLPTKDRLLLTTGRLSSEMLLKAARMEAPIIVSRTSPTARAIALAKDMGIALVGYVRGSRLSVYSHEERLLPGQRAETASGQE